MVSTGGLSGRWAFATSWTVSGGSLRDSVTVESSDSPIEEAALISAPKAPLVLSPPPSADPTPCEITINFPQRCVVRQVYVRSTSRVYEIYCCPKQQGDDEYLCTVRCGIVANSEAPNKCYTGGSSSACLTDSIVGVEEDRCRDDNSNSNDDEWVKVKAPNSPAVTDQSTSLQLKKYMNMDFYEATAEISDAEPCISVTLRLLSIQSGGGVYVGEVYVFVDPVDPISEIQEYKAESSSGNSILSMLVPSLLQISKSKGSSLFQEKTISDTDSHQKQARTGKEVTELDKISIESESTSFSKVNVLEVKSEVASTKLVPPITEPAHPASQTLSVENKTDGSHHPTETVLEQLVARVSRIEDLLMRFEDKMLKPISNIEARMQHVEQQLQALNEKTLISGERSCNRFSAPEYSPSESTFNSLYGNDSEHHDRGELERDKRDCPDKLSVPPEEDKLGFESSGQLLPCLTVTAPDFSQGDDEDEENSVIVTQAEADSPKAKRHASIDDALASALAGFLSSSSTQPRKYSQSLAVRAPEFLNEDENDEENASPRGHLEAASDSSFCLNDSDSVKYEDKVQETAKESDPSKENFHEGCDMADDEAAPVMESISPDQIVSAVENGEGSSETSSVPVPDEAEASNELLQREIKIGSHTVEEEPTSSVIPDSIAFEVLKKEAGEDILNDVLAFSQIPCMLDFETPILDVKFAPRQIGTSKSVLEALLGDSVEHSHAVPSDEGILEASSSQDQSNLIEVDDANLPDINALEVDLEYLSLQEGLVNPDYEEQQDDRTCSYENVSAASLI